MIFVFSLFSLFVFLVGRLVVRCWLRLKFKLAPIVVVRAEQQRVRCEPKLCVFSKCWSGWWGILFCFVVFHARFFTLREVMQWSTLAFLLSLRCCCKSEKYRANARKLILKLLSWHAHTYGFDSCQNANLQLHRWCCRLLLLVRWIRRLWGKYTEKNLCRLLNWDSNLPCSRF